MVAHQAEGEKLKIKPRDRRGQGIKKKALVVFL